MFRIALWAVLLWILGLIFRRILTGGKKRPAPNRPPAGGVPQSGGMMVLDPVCNTYVLRSSARRLRESGGTERFFCSESCERKYLEQKDLAS
jgi:YHS domain-containing protein